MRQSPPKEATVYLFPAGVHRSNSSDHGKVFLKKGRHVGARL